MTLRLALGVSMAVNVGLYVLLLLVRWHADEEIRNAQIEGRREGWFAALRHLPVGRDQSSGNHLN